MHLGERLAELRREAGLTQEGLAERSGVSPDVIRKLEQRRKDGARLSTLRALAGGLGVDVAALVSDATSPVPSVAATGGKGSDDPVKRREFGLAALGGVLAVAPVRGGFGRPVSWPAPAARPGDYQESDLAGHFARQLDAHYETDRHIGPGRLIPTALSEYEALRRFAVDTRSSLRGGLWAVAAGYAGLLGWLCQDAGILGESGRWHDVMLEHAHRAREAQLVAFALYCKAMMLGDEGDGPGVLDLTGSALAQESALVPKVRVLLLQQLAHGHALAGSDGAASTCARLLDKAGSLQDAIDDDYSWGTACRTPRYVDVQRATILTRLGDPAAVALWEQVIPGIPASSGRDLGVFRARYAQSLAGAGEPEQAVAAGASVVPLAASTGSMRMRAELNVLRRRMEPWRGERSWHDLREALVPLSRGAEGD